MKGIEALLTYVRFGSAKIAAAHLGISVTNLYRRLGWLRAHFEAKHTTHLAARLYPWLRDYYAIDHMPRGSMGPPVPSQRRVSRP